MVRLFKRKKMYYADFKTHGKRKRISLDVTNKEAAQKLAGRLELEVAQSGFGILEKEKMRFDEFCTKFLEWSDANHSNWTHKGYKYAIEGVFVPQWGRQPLRSICREDIEEFKAQRAICVKAATVNKDIRYLKAIFNRAVHLRILQENPVKGIRALRQNQRHGRHLEQVEISKVVLAAGEYRPLIITALNTGLRAGELFNLRWADVDFEEKIIRLTNRPEWHTKNYKDRLIPMTELLFDVLNAHRSSQTQQSDLVFSRKNGRKLCDIRSLLKHIEEETGIEHFTLHDLRRTFASHLVFGNAPITAVQELLGHKHIATTMQYTRTAHEHLKSAVEKISYGKADHLGTNVAHSGSIDPEVLRRLSAKLLNDNAGDRNRTGTSITERGILSPLRLPISPLRQLVKREEVTLVRGGRQGSMRRW